MCAGWVAGLTCVAGAVASLMPFPCWSMGITVDVIPNFVGAGVGVTPEWMGSRDVVGGIVPGGRMQFSEHRFVELYGPLADVNVVNVPNWEFGPMLNYRLGRSDVKDDVVDRLPAIGGGVEGGVFGGYNYTKVDGIPWRVRFGVSIMTGLTGDATGTQVNPYLSFWLPLSPKIFVGVGGGVTWASGSFMEQRFGVTQASATASGLLPFAAGAGIRQFYVWPAIIVRVSDKWFVGTGGFYQRLTEDASASPIVSQRGDADQWTVGIGVGYAWK